MQTTLEALKEGFQLVPGPGGFGRDFRSYWSFSFGENKEYELAFEPLLFDNQMYVCLYKDGEVLTSKVVVKPGYIKGGELDEENNDSD